MAEPNQHRPPPRTLDLSANDLEFIEKADKTKTGAPGHLRGENLATLALRWCKVESFGNDPFSGQPWTSEPAPWADPKELLKKLALDASDVANLIRPGGADVNELGLRLGKLLMEANAAIKSKPDAPQASEPARMVHYLYWASRVFHDLEHCEKNLHTISTLPGASSSDIPPTLIAIAAAKKHLADAATAKHVFESAIAPLAIRAAVDELTKSGTGGTVAFGTYSLHAGRLSIEGKVGTGSAQTQPLAQLEFRVQDTGPISVSVGPVFSACHKCIHDVREHFDVVDNAGTPAVRRTLADDASSMSIGYAAMLHYSLWGGTRNQVGVAVGYPLRDQTGTLLSVLAGASYRNTVGLQLSTGVHVFETREPKASMPVDVSSGAATALTPSDVTRPGMAAAWFLFVGATSDLFMKQ